MQSALERTGTAIYVMDNNSNYVDREEIIGFDALYDSMMKSKKGVTKCFRSSRCTGLRDRTSETAGIKQGAASGNRISKGKE